MRFAGTVTLAANAAKTPNVLLGTDIQTLYRPGAVAIRARALTFQDIGSLPNVSVLFSSARTVLADGPINQNQAQDASASPPVPTQDARSAASPEDEVFNGVVPGGTLQLVFERAAGTPAATPINISWDVEVAPV